jgi:adenylate kinase
MVACRFLMVGPPGAGKGTQAKLLAKKLGIPAISTGDIFRANIAEKTELGKQVQTILDEGSYVPDALTNQIVADRLSLPDAQNGFLLDGFPRTEDQVKELDRILADSANHLDAVILLDAQMDVLVQRLLNRALQENRSDDTEEIIRNRQLLYVEQTAPLIATYSARNLVRRVDGLGTVNEVFDRISIAISA